MSGLELLLFRRAYRAGLLARQMPESVYRWGAMASSLPVVFFVLSVPVAFVSSVLAVIIWFLPAPTQLLVNRFRPPEAEGWF